MKNTWRRYAIGASFLGAATLAAIGGPTQSPDRDQYLQRSREFSQRMESAGLAEPFRGVTTDGSLVPGLYEIRSTGVSARADGRK